ncbi:MAG TPA: aminoacyl-tRNA hydrolase [Solimonas sp.]|nr:aminoacyl-tRNA hydrolase [Solimonas sp.]
MPSNALRAIVGLGNPGPDYARTRHNAGFWFVDRFAEAHKGAFRTESKFHGALARVSAGQADVLLLKPSTYMNRSGQAVAALAQFYKLQPTEILVVHDELDLPPGTARLKAGGGHGGHNGLRDVHHHLGDSYLRLRLGVGHPGVKELVMRYLTEVRPGKEDEELISQSIEDAVPAVETWLGGSWDKAMQRLHTSGVQAPKPAPKG